MGRSVVVIAWAATLLLTGCRGMITERLDVHPNGSATAESSARWTKSFITLPTSLADQAIYLAQTKAGPSSGVRRRWQP